MLIISYNLKYYLRVLLLWEYVEENNWNLSA